MIINKLLLIIVLLFIVSCSSVPDNVAGNWKYSFETIKGAIFGYEDYPLTRELVDNIPYASMRLKIGKGSAGLLILETKNDDINTWVSSDEVRIVEKNGQIIRTLGLPNNLTSVRSPETNFLDLVEKTEIKNFKSFISLDNPEVFELKLNVRIIHEGVELVEILDKKYSLIHFIIEKENKYIRWKSKDHYWISPEDGFVWKSIQNISPDNPPFIMEVTKKPTVN